MGKEMQVASLSLLGPRPYFERAWRYFVQNDAKINLSRLPGLNLEKLKQSRFFEKLETDSIVILKGPCTIDIPPGSFSAFIVRTCMSYLVGLVAFAILARFIKPTVKYFYPNAKREETTTKAKMVACAIIVIAGLPAFYWLGTTSICNARIFELK